MVQRTKDTRFKEGTRYYTSKTILQALIGAPFGTQNPKHNHREGAVYIETNTNSPFKLLKLTKIPFNASIVFNIKTWAKVNKMF